MTTFILKRSKKNCRQNRRDLSEKGRLPTLLPPNGWSVVEDETEIPTAEILWDQKSWGLLQADLSKWSGKTVRLQLIADVGPNDDSTADWACFANLRGETAKTVLLTRIEEFTEALK